MGEHSLILEAIQIGLRVNREEFSLVGRFDGRSTSPAAILASRPDVILVDDTPQAAKACSTVAGIKAVNPSVLVVMLTVHEDMAWLDAAAEAGADAAISKSISPASLFTVLREMVDGKVVHFAARVRGAAGPRHRDLSDIDCPLTGREREILTLMAAGATNGHIAKQLLVTEQTVKFHVANILRKLGVANRTEASHYAHLHGLVDGRTLSAHPGLTALGAG